MKGMRIGFIGAGRAGSALATALTEVGHRVVAVADHVPEKAKALGEAVGAVVASAPRVVEEAEVIFLSVPDDVIAGLAMELGPQVGEKNGKIFFHLSGLHPARLLIPLAGEEACGSLHPLLSLAERTSGAARLRGCLYTFEGGRMAEAAARELVASLGGSFLAITAEEKPLYHAAAVMASNYLVALVDVALGLFGRLGLERRAAQEALWPLVEATLANLRALGPEEALTGPISRADLGTVRAHLLRLEAHDEKAATVYRALGTATVALAQRAGRIEAAQAEALLGVLKGEKGDE
ncbi:MAG: Rossmann-like and DUF2520 domain-containing protein [Bacillota bacterium]